MDYPHAKFHGPNGQPREAQTYWEWLTTPFRIPKPWAMALGGWDEWEKEAKTKYPIRFFISEWLPEQFDFIKTRYWDRAYLWLYYRTVRKSHVLKIHSLEPGWWDRDTRMLHACFQLLVDFVELELPNRNWDYYEKNGLERKYGKRDPEAGMDHLTWEINSPDTQHGSPGTSQADTAREKLALYKWWTQDRPARMEPWTTPNIWSYETEEKKPFRKARMRPRGRRGVDCGDMAATLENIHASEDQDMLLRLIAVRHSLWS